MFFDLSKYTFYIKPGATDMRCGIEKIVSVIEGMGLDPFGKRIFLFCGRQRKLIKIFLWDNGYWLLQYKLVRGTFAWPESLEDASSFTMEDIRRLLSGQDIFRAINDHGKRIIY